MRASSASSSEQAAGSARGDNRWLDQAHWNWPFARPPCVGRSRQRPWRSLATSRCGRCASAEGGRARWPPCGRIRAPRNDRSRTTDGHGPQARCCARRSDAGSHGRSACRFACSEDTAAASRSGGTHRAGQRSKRTSRDVLTGTRHGPLVKTLADGKDYRNISADSGYPPKRLPPDCDCRPHVPEQRALFHRTFRQSSIKNSMAKVTAARRHFSRACSATSTRGLREKWVGLGNSCLLGATIPSGADDSCLSNSAILVAEPALHRLELSRRARFAAAPCV